MGTDEAAGGSGDELENVVLDESFIRAARKREPDADSRIERAARIAAQHRQLDAEGEIFAPIPANSPVIRRRGRIWRNRILWAVAILAPVAIVVGALVAR